MIFETPRHVCTILYDERNYCSHHKYMIFKLSLIFYKLYLHAWSNVNVELVSLLGDWSPVAILKSMPCRFDVPVAWIFVNGLAAEDEISTHRLACIFSCNKRCVSVTVFFNWMKWFNLLFLACFCQPLQQIWRSRSKSRNVKWVKFDRISWLA